MYSHYFQFPADLGDFYRGTLKIELDHHSRGILNAVIQEGKPALLMTGHFGNFEIAYHHLSRCSPAMRIVTDRSRDPEVFKILHQGRSREKNNRVIYTDEGLPPLLTALSNAHMLGILADMAPTTQSVEVQFFGQRATASIGPAFLAYRSGAPMVTGGCFRNEKQPNLFSFVVQTPIIPHIRKGQRDQEIKRLTQHYINQYELLIQQFPSQWIWTHNRWRRPGALALGGVNLLSAPVWAYQMSSSKSF